LDPLLTRLCSGIIANSRATAGRFSEAVQSRVHVVYNAVDLEWLGEDAYERPKSIGTDWECILMAARASRDKRHDLAMDAFETIADAHPKAHLLFVGGRDVRDPKWWKSLHSRTAGSLFRNRIHWIGPVEDIRPWYRTASVLILPSKQESFGRVLVEAMSFGVPVVTTRGGGAPEIIREGENGLLTKPGDAGTLARAVLEILNDPVLKSRLGQGGIERARHFNLKKHVGGMMNVFEQTIDRRKRHR
jgi:glycosyltransferase involved in cell wall biosynthesis